MPSIMGTAELVPLLASSRGEKDKVCQLQLVYLVCKFKLKSASFFFSFMYLKSLLDLRECKTSPRRK